MTKKLSCNLRTLWLGVEASFCAKCIIINTLLSALNNQYTTKEYHRSMSLHFLCDTRNHIQWVRTRLRKHAKRETMSIGSKTPQTKSVHTDFAVTGLGLLAVQAKPQVINDTVSDSRLVSTCTCHESCRCYILRNSWVQFPVRECNHIPFVLNDRGPLFLLL